MSALLILVIALVLLALGYIFYGSWLAKQWGVDPNRETPAHTSYDGKDFVPANPAVLMGHHFSSIAGAGPINGPIQAAVFGWVPVFLWCVLGGIFFGAMHDFGALFASIRHNGGSIGEIIKDSMGVKAQRLFIVFALAVLILVIASFTSVVASTFEANFTGNTYDAENNKTPVTFKMEEKPFTEGTPMFTIAKTEYNKVGAAAEFNDKATYYTAEYVPAEIKEFAKGVAYYVQKGDTFAKINSSSVKFDANTTYYTVKYNKAEISAFEKGVTYFTKTDTYALATKAEEGKTYYAATAADNQFVKIGVNYLPIKQLTATDKFTGVEGTVKAFVPVGSINTTGHVLPNASTAMTSMLFILLAVIFGFFVYRKNAKVGPATVIGIIGIIAIVFLGLKVGLNMSRTFWVLFIAVYVMVASLLPVWILLQPRDYLSSFLLYGMMILALVAIIGGTFKGAANMEVEAFTTWKLANGQTLFPFLFITVACGACSGFHSLISSGTSSKQISNEKDAQIIGYGSMIIESALGIISLIAVGVVFSKAQSGVDSMSMSSPPTIFAGGIATLFASFAPSTKEVIRNLFTLAVSVFALTSLDSATRLCRYLFVELLTPEGKEHGDLKGLAKIFSNPVASTLLMVIIGCGIGFLNLNQIWGVFGAANQLLAGIAMLAVCTWLGKIGRNNKMFYFPMAFMVIATITALTITILNKIKLIAGQVVTDGVVSKAVWGDWFQMLWSVLLVVLAVILVITGIKTLSKQGKKA